MQQGDYNWKKLRAEYIKGGISYQKLADKYGLSVSSISKVAVKEKWNALRKEKYQKTAMKTVEKISDAESDALALHFKANDLMAKLLVQILEDDELRALYLHGGRDLKDYMTALNSSEQMKRREKNILTKVEEERLAMERKRLEIEEKRANAGDSDDEDTGVIMLAPVEERKEADDDE